MLRCASSFVTAAYAKVRLIPQDSRALPAAFLRCRPVIANFITFYESSRFNSRQVKTMKCPFCAHAENKVIDSRISKDGKAIRRRRECMGCGKRFTTYEFVEDILPMVVKKDGRREVFDRMKIRNGVLKACEKRPISMEAIEKLVENVEQDCQEYQGDEIPSTVIGEKVMNELKTLDGVAYVRFASVYRQFRDVGEFMAELNDLLSKDKS
jgi:transcriptional repressor NrdR